MIHYTKDYLIEDATMFVLCLAIGSFMEYFYHRIMHYNPPIIKNTWGKKHQGHHESNSADGILREFCLYLNGAAVFLIVPFFILPLRKACVWLVCALTWCLFTSVCHQASHENPCLLFWQSMPVHYVHHKYNEVSHNFGISTDFWDRVFGTYYFHPYWCGELELERYHSKGGFLDLRWRTDQSPTELALRLEQRKKTLKKQ